MSTTPFTFKPYDATEEDDQITQEGKNSIESTSTAFTFAPLDATTSANSILNTSLTNANVNDATSVYATSDIPEVNLSAVERNEEFLNNQSTVYKDEGGDDEHETSERSFEGTTERVDYEGKNQFETTTSDMIAFPTTIDQTNFRKDRKFSPKPYDVTSELTNAPIMTPRNDEIFDTTSAYDKEATNDFKTTLTFHAEQTNDSHDIDPQKTLIPDNDLSSSVTAPVESSTFVSRPSESTINLEKNLLTPPTMNETRFDGEYLNDRNTSFISEMDDMTTAKTKTNNLFNYLLMNAIKNGRNGNETNSMEHKLEKEESAGDFKRGFWLFFFFVEHV